MIGLPFPGAGRIWDVAPADRDYINLSANQINQDFAGILLGDVNGNFTQPNAPVTLATLSLPEAVVQANAQTTLLLGLGLPQGQLFGAELQISYDPAVVSVIAVESGNLVSDWLRAVNTSVPGTVRVAFADAAYNQMLTAAGGTGGYNFAVTSGALHASGCGGAQSHSMIVSGAGLLFYPLPHPVRLLDTRAGFTGCHAPGTPLQGGIEYIQTARGACAGIEIAATALGLVGNATVVNSGGGYLTFWPSSEARPLIATSNFVPGQVFNLHFLVGLGNADGAFKIFSPLATDLVIDVPGFFAP